MIQVKNDQSVFGLAPYPEKERAIKETLKFFSFHIEDEKLYRGIGDVTVQLLFRRPTLALLDFFLFFLCGRDNFLVEKVIDHDRRIVERALDVRPVLHVHETAPGFRVFGKPFHKRGVAILTAVLAAGVGVDRIIRHRQVGFGQHAFYISVLYDHFHVVVSLLTGSFRLSRLYTGPDPFRPLSTSYNRSYRQTPSPGRAVGRPRKLPDRFW